MPQTGPDREKTCQGVDADHLLPPCIPKGVCLVNKNSLIFPPARSILYARPSRHREQRSPGERGMTGPGSSTPGWRRRRASVPLYRSGLGISGAATRGPGAQPHERRPWVGTAGGAPHPLDAVDVPIWVAAERALRTVKPFVGVKGGTPPRPTPPARCATTSRGHPPRQPRRRNATTAASTSKRGGEAGLLRPDGRHTLQACWPPM